MDVGTLFRWLQIDSKDCGEIPIILKSDVGSSIAQQSLLAWQIVSKRYIISSNTAGMATAFIFWA